MDSRVVVAQERDTMLLSWGFCPVEKPQPGTTQGCLWSPCSAQGMTRVALVAANDVQLIMKKTTLLQMTVVFNQEMINCCTLKGVTK